MKLELVAITDGHRDLASELLTTLGDAIPDFACYLMQQYLQSLAERPEIASKEMMFGAYGVYVLADRKKGEEGGMTSLTGFSGGTPAMSMYGTTNLAFEDNDPSAKAILHAMEHLDKLGSMNDVIDAVNAAEAEEAKKEGGS